MLSKKNHWKRIVGLGFISVKFHRNIILTLYLFFQLIDNIEYQLIEKIRLKIYLKKSNFLIKKLACVGKLIK